MQIDTTTPFGARALERVQREEIAWMTTVGKDGTPHPKPVWFLWEDGSFLVYTGADTAKLRHIARHPRVALNLNGDAHGGDIVVFTGSAAVDEGAPAADAHPAYLEKYRRGIAAIGMTPESFAAAYQVAVRFTPEKVSGH